MRRRAVDAAGSRHEAAPPFLGMRGMRDGGEQAQEPTKDDVQHSIYDSTITPP